MPNRSLTIQDQNNMASISQWLNENINGGPITPIPANLTLIPKVKGIYLWFLHPEGYAALSNFVEIEPMEVRYEKKIGGSKYHLVYLGTAGTGKKGNSHLFERLKWHIDQDHSKSSICSDTLSTLRAGIGSLISEDLILPNTRELVDDLFKKYFKVYWISYEGKSKAQIDSDEVILIKTVRPLLNIRNNPNAAILIPINPTAIYKVRRNNIYQSSRLRLNCEKNTNTKITNKMPTSNLPSYEHQVLQDTERAIEFTVMDSQSIHEVVNGIANLPKKGICSFIIRDSANLNSFVYESKSNKGWRKTGNGKQNIYTYFKAPDTNDGNIPRWKVIQNEMLRKKIKEITIRIITNGSTKPDSNDEVTASIGVIIPPRTPIKTSYANPIPRPEENLIKICFLIPCSSRKNSDEVYKYDSRKHKQLEFDKELGKYRNQILSKILNCKVHTRKPGKPPIAKQNIDMNLRGPAHKVYNGRFFNAADSKNWTTEQSQRVYIISALFGIIRADDYIPIYDLAMEDIIDKDFTPLAFWKGKLDSIISKIHDENGKVYDLLSNSYLKVLNNNSKIMLTDPGINFTNNERSVRPKIRGNWLRKVLKRYKN